ncbi:MAG: ribosome silencing factor [Bacteroidota bacterium]
MDTKAFTLRIVKFILSKKGYDINILDLRTLTPIADYFIIASADSNIQVKAIADEIDGKLRKEGIKCYFKEGYNAANWVLLDYFDVVVHIFKKDSREFYNLEKLWGDAPSETIVDELDENNVDAE